MKILLLLVVFIVVHDLHVSGDVSCGRHSASTCNDCVNENGAQDCRGECQWLAGECLDADYEDDSSSIIISEDCQRNSRTGRCSTKKRGCFPSTAVVHLLSGDTKMMQNLEIGEMVLTKHKTYSKLVGWMDINREEETTFLSLMTNLSTSVGMTLNHIVFIKTQEEDETSTKYGNDIQIGDVLLHEVTGQKGEVIKISKFVSNGYFAPLTETGTLVVDGYLASCYASFPHWAANIALYPARTWPAIFLGNAEEGTGTFVKFIKSMGNLFNLRNTLPALVVKDASNDEF